MPASSVTGLFNNGVGSVDGSSKGSERMTLGTSHLIGPRLVAAGTGTLTSASPSVATITFPKALELAASNYSVNVTPIGATAAIAAAGLAVSALSTTSFVVTGPNSVTTSFYWSVHKMSY